MMKHISNSYLTFALGEEKFAIPVEHVQEVVEFGQVTKVPNAPAYMVGIINLRGRILPLLDTKLKLGLPPTTRSQKSRIMVLDLVLDDEKSLQIGAMVDHAREVVELHRNEIQDAPEFENIKSSAPITGIVNRQGDITMIMHIARVFSMSEVAEVSKSLN